MTLFAANKKISDMAFCALDLETTGINSALHAIVEVGIVRFTMNGMRKNYEQLVDPGRKIPKEAINVHGITDDMVAGAPRIGDLLFNITEMLQGSILVIHNPGFDLSFLRWAFLKNDMIVPDMAAVDTIRLSRLAYPNLKNHKLETICRAMNFDVGHHRAYGDAIGCMSIFMDIMRRKDPAGQWTIEDLQRYHGDFIHIKKGTGRRVTMPGKRMMGIRLGEAIRIKYIDCTGSITYREIIPHEFIDNGGETYVVAHCHLRNDKRCFNMNRIIEIV